MYKQLTVVRAIVSGAASATELTYFTALPLVERDLVLAPYGNSSRLAIITKVESVGGSKQLIKRQDYGLKSIKTSLGIRVSACGLAALYRYAELTANSINKSLDLVGPRKEKLIEPIKLADSSAPEREKLGYKSMPIFGSLSQRIAKYLAVIETNSRKNITTLVCSFSKTATSKIRLEIKNLAKTKGDFELKSPIIAPRDLILYSGKVGGLIIERENAGNLASITGSRDFNLFLDLYARAAEIPIYWGDASLSLDRYPLVLDDDYRPISLSIKSGRELFSDEAKELIDLTLNKAQNMLILAPKAGIGHFPMCRDCRTMLACEKCDVALSLHVDKNGIRKYICPLCRTEYPGESRCRKCNSWNIDLLSKGKQNIVSEIRKLYGKNDHIAVTTLSGLRDISKEFANSIFIEFDHILASPNYSARQSLYEGIVSLRAITSEKVLLQTSLKNSNFLDKLAEGDYRGVKKAELALRRKLHYPPFYTILKLTEKRRFSGDFKKLLAGELGEYAPVVYRTKWSVGGKSASVGIIRVPRESWPDTKLLETLNKLNNNIIVEIDPKLIT